MLNQLISHKTIRKYSEKDLSDQILNRCLTAATRASNNGNMQTYSIIVTRDSDVKKALAPAHFNQPMITEAPVVLTFCVDYNRFDKWCELRDAKPGYDNVLSFASAFIDASLVAQNFAVAAEGEGLGICYIGTTMYNPDKIIETLKMPKMTFPVTTVTVGYPAEVPARQEDRLPINGVCHHEVYEDYDESEINRIYAQKEALESTKEFISINNKETLAQIFTDIRYTKADNEACSTTILDTMKRQGFLK